MLNGSNQGPEKSKRASLGGAELSEGKGKPKKKKSFDASRALVQLALEPRLIRSPQGEVYSIITVKDHNEVIPLRNELYKAWLIKSFYERYGIAPNGWMVQNTIDLLLAKGIFEAEEQSIYVRVGGNDETLYLDLCNAHRDIVEITKDGWRLISKAPVFFRRPPGMQALPTPIKNGSIELLRPFLPFDDERRWKLFVGSLVGALRAPEYPCALLAVQGEQGSGKSTVCSIFKGLIDPSRPIKRSLPRSEQDLMIAANNMFILNFDNISSISDWMSDAFSRIATGGGFATRKLYTDDSECVFDLIRTAVLNGIVDIIERPDLASRATILNLPLIDETTRRDESEFWKEFELVKPSILGGLLDAVVGSIQNLPTVRLSETPRMADFSKWVTAAEPVLGWEPESFLEAFTKNQITAIEENLETNLLAQAVSDFVEQQLEWIGTWAELYEHLNGLVDDRTQSHKQWPKAAHALSRKMKRLAPSLRATGMVVDLDPATLRKGILLRKTEENTVESGNSDLSSLKDNE